VGSSPTSRQYIRKDEGIVSPLTSRLSRSKHIELTHGKLPGPLAKERKEKAARGEPVEYPSGEKGRKSAEATRRAAGRKKAYPDETLPT
jgi:hypothetical protein